MELINQLAQAYAERFTTPEDQVLRTIAESTVVSHPEHHMLSGQLQGAFLRFISEIMKPRRILEVGTFTGYSAICLARGLDPEGRLHTIELNSAVSKVAENNFNLANLKDKIILHTGNALEIIPVLHEAWDLVFLDADKSGYLQYYKMIVPELRSGALLLADNVLFHGKVLEKDIRGKSARAIQAFNEYVSQDNSVESILLTIRDGLLMIKKK